MRRELYTSSSGRTCMPLVAHCMLKCTIAEQRTLLFCRISLFVIQINGKLAAKTRICVWSHYAGRFSYHGRNWNGNPSIRTGYNRPVAVYSSGTSAYFDLV